MAGCTRKEGESFVLYFNRNKVVVEVFKIFRWPGAKHNQARIRFHADAGVLIVREENMPWIGLPPTRSGCLVITRYRNERVHLITEDQEVIVMVRKVKRSSVMFGIRMPHDVRMLRSELTQNDSSGISAGGER